MRNKLDQAVRMTKSHWRTALDDDENKLQLQASIRMTHSLVCESLIYGRDHKPAK